MEVEIVNLENRISALPSVQRCREVITSNGCKATLEFRATSNPQVERDVAEMLIAAFEKKRSMDYEASSMSVQSINKGTS